MREWGLRISNYLIFLLAGVVLVSLQTSLWLQVLGQFPAPSLWVLILAYWTIHRRFHETIIITYLLTLTLAPYTVLPSSFLLTVNLMLVFLGFIAKQRIYWPGATYFMMVSALGTIMFPIINFVFSYVFEERAIIYVKIFDWLISSLLTALAAMVVYRMFLWFDKITQKELPSETGNQML